MFQILISAGASGSGKTVVTCALLAALQNRGLSPCAFKCGPDYIDPMFHRRVLGVDSHNLDLFLSDENYVRHSVAQYSTGHGAMVCEGAMGLYDGCTPMSTNTSAWHVADLLNLPVLLVVKPGGASLTLAAQIKGLCDFRQPSHIVGILLNNCSEGLYKGQAPMLEHFTGLPVVGYLPPMEEAKFQSRHLGLKTAGEIEDLTARINLLAVQFEKSVDLDRLIKLCDNQITRRDVLCKPKPISHNTVIAVARDEAFCFCYEESLDALRYAGAEIRFFSPLHDLNFPKAVDGLYLPGGYPELYAKQLSENVAMRDEIKAAIESGLPTIAECGGFLYLGRSLQDENGDAWTMAGLLPGEGIKTERLQQFGYAELMAKSDSMLLKSGESTRIHEFHYWDSSNNGDNFIASKPALGRSWQCGFASKSLYAAFPHLYLAGDARLVHRFIHEADRCRVKRMELDG